MPTQNDGLAVPQFPSLHDFTFVRRISSGGSADVFQVSLDGAGSNFALKRWRAPVAANARRKFTDECRLQIELSEHINIVRLYFCEAPVDEPAWLLTELYDESLADRLSRDPALDTDEKLNLVEDFLTGLTEMHARGYVHRDVKPANILLKDGRAALTDLGLAMRVGDVTTANGAGTYPYSAPELNTGAPPTPRSDVYSAATVVVHMFAGALPPNIESVVERAQSQVPEQRPATARQLRDLLRHAAVTDRPAVRPTSAPDDSRMRTLTLVMSDVQGSTRLWQEQPDAMDAAMDRQRDIVHRAVERHGGYRPPDRGDGDLVFAAFTTPVSAIAAVTQIQRDLAIERWPTTTPLRVRVGVHSGEVRERGGNLFGNAVNRCALVRELATGGQTLMSSAVFELVRDQLPAGAAVQDLGEQRMKDLTRHEHIYQLDVDALPSQFPPLASLDRVRHNLPVHVTPFIGRDRDLQRIVELLQQHRMVTVSGLGGMGKTRLALQVAAELAASPSAEAGEVWLVDLSLETDPATVPARIAEAAGVAYNDDAGAALIKAFQDRPALLVLDNLEQLLDCATFLAQLLAGTNRLRVLATSREAVRIRAEHVWPLEAMTLPPANLTPTDPEDEGGIAGVDVARLTRSEAARFFLDRAQAVKPDFALTSSNADVVAAICVKVDGHPLALELAASRLRMVNVDELLTRLNSALQFLANGSRDLPDRHRTLRATIAWSYDSIKPDEQVLLARMSTLAAPADLVLLDAVYGEGLDLFGCVEGLLNRSMVRTYESDSTADQTRYGLLIAVRDYAAEHLDPAKEFTLRDRHADHITQLLRSVQNNGIATYQFTVQRLLPHIRAALEHLARTPDERYVDLAVALGDMLVAAGSRPEAEKLALHALQFATQPLDRANLLATLAYTTAPQNLKRQRVRDAYTAALSSGDPELICTSAIDMLQHNPDDPQTDHVLQSYETSCGKLTGHRRADVTSNMANAAGATLRFTEPDHASELLNEHLATYPHDGASRVRLARIRLDHGDIDAAENLLDERNGPIDWRNNALWVAIGDVERGRAALTRGAVNEARRLLTSANNTFTTLGVFSLYPCQALTDLYRDIDNPHAIVATVNEALNLTTDPGIDGAILRWRRARAKIELGDTQNAATELDTARRDLQADPIYGPHELLGCLAAIALLIHQDDPDRSAELLTYIEAKRRGWVLPHYADRDTRTVQQHLNTLVD